VARELIARVKYRNVRAVVPWLAAAMAGELAASAARVGVVTWAPTTPEHRRSRGFDPAELLARAVARRLHARCVRLLRRRPGPPQTGLDAAARRRGPRFTARRVAPPRVLLVDDVATTGATLAAAAAALRAAGAREIVALTAARKNRPVSSRLRATAKEKVARIARFTHDAARVEVDFSELRNPRIAASQLCEVTVHLKRHFVKAHAAAAEPEAALDLVVDKVEHQVARIKDKRVTRSHPRRRSPYNSNGNGVPAFEEGDTETEAETNARIVKTKRFTAKPMDPEEAALQMELLGHDFFLFINTETGNAAVLYRRHDGHLGLIETTG
jgi:putative sigma-54 modulation protein